MNKNNLLLFKLLVKNDFYKIIIWLVSIIGITLMTAYLYPSMYETQESIQSYANISMNPAMKGLIGGSYPVEAFNHAVIFSQEMLLFTAIAIAVMNIYFSIKFTKVAEEDGIIELVNSKPVSRFSYLTSSIILTLLLNFIIFITIAVGLIIIDIPGSTIISSITYGLILSLIGIVFSGIGFISSKLYNNSSSSFTFSYLMLLIFYIIRAVGDVVEDTVSLFSPLGWLTKVQVFYNNNLIYILLLFLFSIILYIISFYLFKKVDYASGIYNSNYGKPSASPFLKSSFGLIFRLEKIQIFVWTFSLFILTAAFGAVFDEFEVFLEMDIIKQFFGNNTTNFSETIITYIIKIIALFGLIPSLVIILKLTKEESKAYLDNIYSRNYSRIKYFINHILFAIFISVVMQIIIMLGIYVTGGEFILSVMSFSKLLEIILSYLPAIWIVLSLATLLISLGKTYTKYIWIYFGFLFIGLYLEEILKLPKWLMNLSSFYHVNTTGSNILSSSIMIIISVILFSVSLLIYKKRDIK